MEKIFCKKKRAMIILGGNVFFLVKKIWLDFTKQQWKEFKTIRYIQVNLLFISIKAILYKFNAVCKITLFHNNNCFVTNFKQEEQTNNF